MSSIIFNFLDNNYNISFLIIQKSGEWSYWEILSRIMWMNEIHIMGKICKTNNVEREKKTIPFKRVFIKSSTVL